jgi:hypothetical protein
MRPTRQRGRGRLKFLCAPPVKLLLRKPHASQPVRLPPSSSQLQRLLSLATGERRRLTLRSRADPPRQGALPGSRARAILCLPGKAPCLGAVARPGRLTTSVGRWHALAGRERRSKSSQMAMFLTAGRPSAMQPTRAPGVQPESPIAPSNSNATAARTLERVDHQPRPAPTATSCRRADRPVIGCAARAGSRRGPGRPRPA